MNLSIKTASYVRVQRCFYKVLLVFTFLLLHPLPSCQKKPYLLPEIYIKTINMKCDLDPNWFANVSCKLKPINWERTIADLSLDILQPLRNITVQWQVFRLETYYVPFLINLKRNACDILKKRRMDFYTRVALKFVNEFLNIQNITCPLTGHLEMRNAYLKGSSFALIFPPGTYKLLITAFEGYPPERLGAITFFFNVVERRRRF